MKFTEGTTIYISVQALYEMSRLRFGRVESDGEYFDLYNDDGELVCMDGEEVTIEQVGEQIITFRNDNGESIVYFTLTRKEAEMAIIE